MRDAAGAGSRSSANPRSAGSTVANGPISAMASSSGHYQDRTDRYDYTSDLDGNVIRTLRTHSSRTRTYERRFMIMYIQRELAKEVSLCPDRVLVRIRSVLVICPYRPICPWRGRAVRGRRGAGVRRAMLGGTDGG